MKNNMVKVTCYGRTKEMKRNDAIKLYKEGVECCDGSEKERYMNILIGLMDGKAEVSDEI